MDRKLTTQHACWQGTYSLSFSVAKIFDCRSLSFSSSVHRRLDTAWRRPTAALECHDNRGKRERKCMLEPLPPGSKSLLACSLQSRGPPDLPTEAQRCLPPAFSFQGGNWWPLATGKTGSVVSKNVPTHRQASPQRGLTPRLSFH